MPVSAVILNDTSPERHHGCTSVIGAIERLCASNGIIIVGSHPSNSDWRSSPEFGSRVESANLLIVNGEGTIHSSKPQGEALLAAGEIARASGKRSALINFTWHRNNPEMERLLSCFDIVSVRESISFDALAKIRPDRRMVPDLSLYGPRFDSDRRGGVGFGESVITSVADALIAKSNDLSGAALPIRFAGPRLPNKLYFARSFFSKASIVSLRQVANDSRRLAWHLGSTTDDLSDYLTRLSHLKLFVTGRFHGVALSLRALTPVLAVRSNTPKIEAILADAGLKPWRLIDIAELDRELIERASGWDAEERRNLERYLERAQSDAERLFRDLRALVA